MIGPDALAGLDLQRAAAALILLAAEDGDRDGDASVILGADPTVGEPADGCDPALHWAAQIAFVVAMVAVEAHRAGRDPVEFAQTMIRVAGQAEAEAS